MQDELNRRSAAAQGVVDYGPQDHSFYFQSLDLVNLAIAVGLLIATGGLVVALTEAVVSRRRAYAALVATGVGRGTLARAVLWQSMAPAAPGVLLALAVGTGLAYGLFGTTVTAYDFSVCPAGDCEHRRSSGMCRSPWSMWPCSASAASWRYWRPSASAYSSCGPAPHWRSCASECTEGGEQRLS